MAVGGLTPPKIPVVGCYAGVCPDAMLGCSIILSISLSLQAWGGICCEPRYIEALETVEEIAKQSRDDQFSNLALFLQSLVRLFIDF